MKERGQAVLGLFVMLAMVGVVVFTTTLSPTTGRHRAEQETTSAMSKAKESLIGYAASSAILPGQLPCPDTNNDGIAEPRVAGNCPSTIGRLPWKTLGLDDLRDGAGERLWYAPSSTFTRELYTFDCPAVECFDSDTKGTLTVSQDQAANVITNEAVAVIFAPGSLLPGQLRDVANQNNPANYLDATDGVSNTLPPAFITALNSDWVNPPPASPFNDRLVVISTVDLWTVVEIRIAREIVKLLTQYRAATGHYPWASNDFDDDSVSGDRRGMTPIENALPETWGSLGISVPNYLAGSDSKWGRLFYYAISQCASDGAPAPPSCSRLAYLGNDKDLVLITPGPAGSSRPSTNLSDYFEDFENRNNDDVFVVPSSTAYARDRVYSCPGTPGIC